MNREAFSDELEPLLIACVEDDCDELQSQRMDELLGEDTAALAAYIEMMSMHAILQWRFGSQPDNTSPGIALNAPQQVIVPPVIDAPPSFGFLDTTIPSTVGFFSSDWSLSYLIATVVCGIAALVGSLIYVSRYEEVADNSPPMIAEPRLSPQLPPQPKVEAVGRITGMVDCKLAKGSDPLSGNDVVSLGREFKLDSGLLEIGYNTGAKVILQGPATYVVEASNGGFMRVGKLTGKVTTAGAKGFAVRTPTATVTDLGTEFGVEVSKQGYTTSHVFRGLVRVQLLRAGARQQGPPIILRENESIRTEKDGAIGNTGMVLRHVSVDPSIFARRVVRQPPKVVDLLDIVAFGNGLGRRREMGVDPGTGMTSGEFLAEEHKGDGRFERISLHESLDGVFIPAGGHLPTTLDSAGHTFNGFPQTCGASYGLIWSRGADVRLVDRVSEAQFWVYNMGSGEQFMPERRGLLCMHANAGITFRLDALTKAWPGLRPVRFRAVGGVTKVNPKAQRPNATNYKADFSQGSEGWDFDGDNPYWNSTGGQDGGGYAGGVRTDFYPYLIPPTNSILYGDLAATFGSPLLRFSYYLKNFSGSPIEGSQLKMFADTDADGSWDTIWCWTPNDTSVPRDWRRYTWTVDATAKTAPSDWTREQGSGSWADSWKHVKLWNFWNGQGSGEIRNGIDNVVVSGVDPDMPTHMGGYTPAAREQLADVWVFVDGRLKLKRTQLRPEDGAVPIDVELGANDRFLTIVSTDGGNGNWCDRVVFGDPVSDMAPIKMAPIKEDRP